MALYLALHLMHFPLFQREIKEQPGSMCRPSGQEVPAALATVNIERDLLKCACVYLLPVVWHSVIDNKQQYDQQSE